MNVLVLRPGNRNLGYALVSITTGRTVLSNKLSDYRQGGEDQQVMGEAIADLWEKAGKRGNIRAIAIEVACGGVDFTGPVVADESVLTRLSRQTSAAPLHLPVVISLARACRHVLPDTPVVLTFQVSFFGDLPLRERSYGIDPDLAARLGLRRFGYYGLYHDAACSHVVHLHKEEIGVPRIISICLDKRTELSAVVGRKPVLVTSGATALEGLPGLTTAGEMDPSIVLMLSRELKWGPEQINTVLTQQSGLLGLCGRPVTSLALFRSQAAPLQLAKQLMQYRLLLACGSAIAAMGGVDEIIFSGCYAQAGQYLGPWLSGRLSQNPSMGQVSWHVFAHPIEQIVSEQAMTVCLPAMLRARRAAPTPA